jgi:hypothetical protein
MRIDAVAVKILL